MNKIPKYMQNAMLFPHIVTIPLTIFSITSTQYLAACREWLLNHDYIMDKDYDFITENNPPHYIIFRFAEQTVAIEFALSNL